MKTAILAATCAFVWIGPRASAAEPAAEPATARSGIAVEQAARTLGRCFSESAVAAASIDLDRFDVADWLKRTFEITGNELCGVHQNPLAGFADLMAKLKAAGVHRVYVCFSPTSLDESNPYYVVPVAPGSSADRIREAVRGPVRAGAPHVGPSAAMQFRSIAVVGDAVIVGNGPVVAELDAAAPPARPELVAALAADGDAPLVFTVVLSADQRRALEQALPQLPPALGGAATRVLTRGLKWMTLAVDPSAGTVQLNARSDDAAAATAFQQFVRDLVIPPDSPWWARSIAPNGRLPEDLVPHVDGDTITLKFKPERVADGTKRGLRLIGKSMSRQGRRDQIKHLVLAMHNYHDVHKHFPPAANYDNKGRPLLSWRVHLLPFIDGGNTLYKRFHLDEPWDSQHNKALIAEMPEIYRSIELNPSQRGTTTILGVRGAHSVFRGSEGTPIRAITDGTSNSAMLVAARPDRAVVWTQPADFDADAQTTVADFNGPDRDGFWVGLCDGSCRFLDRSLSDSTFRSLLTIDGGEPVSLP